MTNDPYHRRIESWLRLGVAIGVPLTVVVGLWLLLGKHETPLPPQPTDGSAHVVAFPAEAGPPKVTLHSSPPHPTGSTASTP